MVLVLLSKEMLSVIALIYPAQIESSHMKVVGFIYV